MEGHNIVIDRKTKDRIHDSANKNNLYLNLHVMPKRMLCIWENKTATIKFVFPVHYNGMTLFTFDGEHLFRTDGTQYIIGAQTSE